MRLSAGFRGICLLMAFTSGPVLGQSCVTDADCSNSVFCDGAEVCAPGAKGSDQRGCSAGPPACMANWTCSEAGLRCTAIVEDRDGDGHHAMRTNGDDCNDNDGNEFPGNAEVWDAIDHDEDCDPRTHGFAPGFGPDGPLADQVRSDSRAATATPTLAPKPQLAPMVSASVAPLSAATAPSISKPACVPPLVTDAKSGACVAAACPDGMYREEKSGACLKK